MTTLENKLLLIIQDIDLGEITETKKLSLLDEIGAVLTNRIILSLLKEVPAEKKDIFIAKINENKDNPDKILLFIDHFVENADEIIDFELEKYKNDLQDALQKT
jgi:hypothetical protein